MKFSVCIPNYNYERYLGKTVQSVLDQQGVDFEVLVSDNASTDGSLAVVRGFNDSRIQIHVNAINVGFSANLDRAARMASGDFLIMLSSDDLIRADALATYEKLLGRIHGSDGRTVVSATWDVISSTDEKIGRDGPHPELWTAADRVEELEKVVGGPVYRVRGDELLRRCLQHMKNPFNFATTCYSRQLYDAVEGYGGGRMMNPDKWFNWKVLTVRWPTSSTCLCLPIAGTVTTRRPKRVRRALKYLVDEYVSTLELDSAVLARIGLPREAVQEAFVEHDVIRHAFATLARGQRVRARRILDFGRAAYPQQVRRNRKALALRALLAMGPVGQKIAERAYRSYRAQNGQPSRQ